MKNREIRKRSQRWMKKPALLACLSVFFLCCSRAGENPLPIEPLLPRSEYDLEASELKIQNQQGGPHRPRIKIGSDVWIFTSICNVGLQPIPGAYYGESLEVNGKIVHRHSLGVYSSFGPLAPGGCNKGAVSLSRMPEEPGRYEFKFQVHLSSRLEEENKDNNELVLVVEVEQ